MIGREQRAAKPDRLYVADKDEEFVYHWFNNSASPSGDQNMYLAQHEGWEPAMVDPKTLPAVVRDQLGNTPESGGGAVALRRGDLVLYRMPKRQWEETVHRDTVENMQRMEVTMDTMVAQAQEQAARSLRDRGQKRIPGNLVFRENVGDPVD